MSLDTIFQLTRQDFHLKPHKKSNLLGTNFEGASLVLFHSSNCVYCSDFLPIYRQLPMKIPFFKYGIINLNQGDNKQVYELSKQTIEPIVGVPMMVVYNDGKPIMIYDGPRQLQFLIEFLSNVQQLLQSRSNFRTSVQTQQTSNNQQNPLKNGKLIEYNLVVGDDKKNCFQPLNRQFTCNLSDSTCYTSSKELQQNCEKTQQRNGANMKYKSM